MRWFSSTLYNHNKILVPKLGCLDYKASLGIRFGKTICYQITYAYIFLKLNTTRIWVPCNEVHDQRGVKKCHKYFFTNKHCRQTINYVHYHAHLYCKIIINALFFWHFRSIAKITCTFFSEIGFQALISPNYNRMVWKNTIPVWVDIYWKLIVNWIESTTIRILYIYQYATIMSFPIHNYYLLPNTEPNSKYY